MALRIGDLTPAANCAGSDELEFSLAGSAGSRKITAENLRKLMLAGGTGFTAGDPIVGGTVSGTIITASDHFAGPLTGNVTGNADTATSAASAGACTGNAATATALQTPRTINGIAFDGTANIVVPTSIGPTSGLHATKTWDPTVVAPSNTTTVAVAGAVVGDLVLVNNVWLADNSFLSLGAYVSAPDVVTLVLVKVDGSNIAGTTSRTVHVWVLKF